MALWEVVSGVNRLLEKDGELLLVNKSALGVISNVVRCPGRQFSLSRITTGIAPRNVQRLVPILTTRLSL